MAENAGVVLSGSCSVISDAVNVIVNGLKLILLMLTLWPICASACCSAPCLTTGGTAEPTDKRQPQQYGKPNALLSAWREGVTRDIGHFYSLWARMSIKYRQTVLLTNFIRILKNIDTSGKLKRPPVDVILDHPARAPSCDWLLIFRVTTQAEVRAVDSAYRLMCWQRRNRVRLRRNIPRPRQSLPCPLPS